MEIHLWSEVVRGSFGKLVLDRFLNRELVRLGYPPKLKKDDVKIIR